MIDVVQRMSLTSTAEAIWDEVRIQYWRQAIRLAQALIALRVATAPTLGPIQGYMWVPATALLLGVLLGMMISMTVL